MPMFFAMRARNAANTLDLTWVSECLPDPNGNNAPSAILPGSAFVTFHWGTRGQERYAMRARNAANNDFLSWVSPELDTTGVYAPGGPSAIFAGTAIVEMNFSGASELTSPNKDEIQAGISSTNMNVWPLTYDEEDSNGFNHLTRLGSALGPHVTPLGLRGNNFNSVYSIATPSWQTTASQSLSMHAIASIGLNHLGGSNACVIVNAASSSSSDVPKLELASVDDASLTGISQIALRANATSNQTIRLGRAHWKFEFRYPELIDGNIPSAQALCWIDNNTLLITCHESNTETVMYRVNTITGEYTGKAVSTFYIHVGSIHKNAAGEFWGTDNFSGGAGYSAFKIDLDKSFICGEIETITTWDISLLLTNGGLAFITVSGTEYVLLQRYDESGSSFLYVYLTSAMNAPATVAGRFKRFNVGFRCQDICMRASDGLLYISRNVANGVAGAFGYIQSFDIATAITNIADGSTLVEVATYIAASEYAEGIDFHPVTDRLWHSTEGLSSVSDLQSHIAVWSCSIPQVPEENVYLIDYNGTSDLLEVRVNGRLQTSQTLNITGTPVTINIGGHAGAGAAWGGRHISGDSYVKSVAIKDGPFTSTELSNLANGAFETKTLVSFPVTIVNPGAESLVTGWTSDAGAGTLINRASNPVPFAGASYFCGSNSVDGRFRQRFSLATVTGYSSDQVDEQAVLTELWGDVVWQQASFDGGSDPGQCGLKSLDASNVQITLGTDATSRIFVTPSLTWRKRATGLGFIGGVRGFDILQDRVRTVGTSVDCYVDEITTIIYDQARDSGTSIVSSITTANDTSSTNYDMTTVGANPLSVKGPMGTDFSRAFGIGRSYAGAAAAGPISTFTGSSWTWETMVYLTNYSGATFYLAGATGTDSLEANNTVFQLVILTTGNLRLFYENGLGVNVNLDTILQLPIGRWFHLRIRCVPNSSNKDFTFHMTLPGETPVTIGTFIAQLPPTGGTAATRSASIAPGGWTGKIAYMRISNIDRGTSDLSSCASNPAANITADGNTTGFYSLQERS